VSTYSITEQNYIKAIYHLQQKHNIVSTNQLSAALVVKASTATDMLKKLEVKKMVDYLPYKGFTLTNKGSFQALQIIRRHRLWEYFLVKKLQLDWNEVHAIAEELEHIDNNGLIEKLAKYLNNPQYDPHGDPIPDAEGNMPKNTRVPITAIEVHKKARI
jgi:DtxR family transcriptional regulator, Mn-dependent transcriptional regulator